MAFSIAALLRSTSPTISRPFTTAPPCHADPFPTPVPFSLAGPAICPGSMGQIHLDCYGVRSSLRARPVYAVTGDDVAEPATFVEGPSTPSRLADVAPPCGKGKAREVDPASSVQERKPELLPSTWATPRGYLQAAHHAATRAHARLIGCLDDATCHPYAPLDGTSVMVAEALRPSISYRAGLDGKQYDHRDSHRVEGRPVGPYDVQIPLTQIDNDHWLILRMATEPPYTRVPYSRSTGNWASRTVRTLPSVFRAVCQPRLTCSCSDDDDDLDSDGGDPGFELPSSSAMDGFDQGLIFQMDDL